MTASRWGDRIPRAEAERVVRQLLDEGHLARADAVLVHDMDRMAGRIAQLRDAFPEGTLHAIAVKANPVIGILRACVEAGAGLECASLPEVHCSLAAGSDPGAVIFDSPAKTRSELRETLASGVYVNANSFAELDRIAEILGGPTAETNSVVGLRVNPEVGAGTIAATSVAHSVSKMGVPINEHRDAIVQRFVNHSWLCGLHVHVGSQGCSMSQLVAAAVAVGELAEAIEHAAPGRLENVDLGGGLPVAYAEGDAPPSLDRYVAALRDAVPSLFDGQLRLATEFGRCVQANCGLAVSRVEYVERGRHDRQLAIIHLGADFLMRPVYNPNDWAHEFLVLDPQGRLRDGDPIPTQIGGPLCFGGDLPARAITLPPIEPGDLIVVRDTGAYTLSLWSRHCSRTQPAVLGLSDGALTTLRPAETVQDIVRHWGG